MRDRQEHWANKVEHTSVLGIRVLFALYRVLGRLPFCFALAPVVFFIWASDSAARKASGEYLQKAYRYGLLSKAPGAFTSLKHMYRFAETILDKMLAVWAEDYAEKLTIENESLMTERLNAGQGAVVLTSHMGCVEALMHHGSMHKVPAIALVHSANTERFTKMVEGTQALRRIEFWEVTELNPARMIELQAKCDAGYFVFIAGDRVPIHSEATVRVPFLGEEASFPTGGVILAHILKLPLLSMTCWRESHAPLTHRKETNGYRVRFAMLAQSVSLPRKNRQKSCADIVARYVAELELGLKKSPFDWFNFYRFWN